MRTEARFITKVRGFLPLTTCVEDEHIAKGLFGCYVRLRNYAKLQQYAMKLYKLFNQPEYMLWAASAICVAIGERHEPQNAIQKQYQMAELLCCRVMGDLEVRIVGRQLH